MKRFFTVLTVLCLLMVDTVGIQVLQAKEDSSKISVKTASSQREYVDEGTYSFGKLHWGITADHELYIWGNGLIKNTDPWASSPYMDSVETVIIEKGITEIDGKCFYCRTSIKNVYLPNDSSYIIGVEAFEGCSSLQTINLTGATSVYIAAFRDCTSLRSVIFEKNCDYGNWSFDGCSSLTSVDIPCRVVPRGMFANTSSLKHVTFASNTTKICTYAFAGSGIEHLILPEGLRCVETTAFQNCPDLKTLYFPRTLIYVEYAAFEGATGLTDVYYTGDYYDLIEQVCYTYQYGNHTFYWWPANNSQLFFNPTWHYCSMEILQSPTSLR